MPLVRSDHKKIAELGSDDLRRIFTKAVNAFLKENEEDIEEIPSTAEVADVVGDLVMFWEDTILLLVETAVDQELAGLLDVEDDDTEEIDGADVLEPEILE